MTPSPKAVDSTWIKLRCGAYLRGRGISYGCSNDPVAPHQAMDVGKYSISIDHMRFQHTDILDLDLSFIRQATMDHIFIGPRDVVPFKELVEKLTIGGHLIVHSVRDLDLQSHRERVSQTGLWQEKDTYVREGQFLGIWKLVGRGQRKVLEPKPKPPKRALIARYGAIGDMIMIAPLIHQLHDDGYHVTLNITPYCADVLKNNPYVDNLILQERDIIPNPDLGAYWNEWKNDYDKYINLSESIEGKLLKVEGRNDFYTTKEWRSTKVNYFDQTMRLGGYPDAKGRKGELYFSNAELKEAKHIREKFKDKFMIMWALKGSSHHKVYPLLQVALGQWLSAHPDAIGLLVGAEADRGMAFEHPQVVELCGRIPLRNVFCLTQFADVVGGPESSITNAAGCFPTPKITLLSHSEHDNLCQYWENDYCLAPENIPCYPCHQLHYSKESCPQLEIKDNEPEPFWVGPACAAAGINPTRIQAQLDTIYAKWVSSR